MNSNPETAKFIEDLTKSIKSKTKIQITKTLLEILSGHDILIANSLGVDTQEIVAEATTEALIKIKEGD